MKAIPGESRIQSSPLARPLVGLALAAGAGTVLGQLGCIWPVGVAIATLFLGCCGHRLIRRFRRKANIPRATPSWALILGAFLGGLINGAGAGPNIGQAVQEPGRFTVTGRVQQVQHLHWGKRTILSVSSIAGDPVSLVARLNLPDDAPPLRPGDAVLGEANLDAPQKPRNPGGRDHFTSMSRQGIALVGRFRQVTRTASGPMTLERRFDIAREQVRWAARRAASQRLGPEASDDAVQRLEGVLRALSLGEGGAVPPDTRESFANAGLAHLLAVSGLHIGLVAAGLFGLLRWLLLRMPRAHFAVPVSAMIVAPAVGTLVTWVGHPPSAARAGLMAVILLGAAACRRRLCGWSSLSLAAIALLTLEPELALRPGFQLSFAAVAGLLAMVSKTTAKTFGDCRGPMWIKRLKQMGEVTLAAALATAPLCAVHFDLVPFAGNVANFVAVPLTTLLVPLVAVGAVATVTLGEMADMVWLPAAMLARLLIAIADGAAALPLSSVTAPRTGLLALFMSCIGLWWSIKATGFSRRALASALVIIPLVTSAWLDRGAPPDAPLEVSFLAVGHGDSILVRTRYEDILIDAGSSGSRGLDAGATHVVPALRALGVRRLSAVVVSHPHDDHYGGLGSVLDSFPVERLYHSGQEAAEAGPYRDLIDKAVEKGVTILIACRDDLPKIEPASISCLHPRGDAEGGSYYPNLSLNDNSVLLAVELGATRFLLTGDIEAEAEAILMSRGVDLGATVVKAAHHGSNSSSTLEFVRATGAEHVVFPAGSPRGRFDFPDAEVVDRWAEAGTVTWWTNHHGAVTFETDGAVLTVSPFRDWAPPWPTASGE